MLADGSDNRARRTPGRSCRPRKTGLPAVPGAGPPGCRAARGGDARRGQADAVPAIAHGDGAGLCRMRLSWPEPSPRVDGTGLLRGAAT